MPNSLGSLLANKGGSTGLVQKCTLEISKRSQLKMTTKGIEKLIFSSTR